MPISKKEIKKGLSGKFGFREVEGSRHEAIAFFYNEQKIATTRFSRGGSDDIGDMLLKVMAREIRVQRLSFLKEMIGCTKNLNDYINLLREEGYL